ncbi:hypothetical protein [Rhizobium mesosinicum]|uniref:Uncharacterized protein n=1 Tax=Rhizobium mesosinicum TaxID=335017 RepID=A0ABS7GSM9_9HYPH|nr:hypothetical protein [Rhizobium mesosinicum]MBW9052756.1 hypothetical protein [Rhizobium mesosinicum]
MAHSNSRSVPAFSGGSFSGTLISMRVTVLAQSARRTRCAIRAWKHHADILMPEFAEARLCNTDYRQDSLCKEFSGNEPRLIAPHPEAAYRDFSAKTPQLVGSSHWKKIMAG